MKPVVSQEIKITPTQMVTVFALSAYVDPLSRLIRAKNYHDYIAAVQLGKLMGERIALEPLDCDYIVPIPLHWTRRLWRGYNQAEVIAQEIALITGKPVINAVCRVKRTILQAALTRIARYNNVQNAFILDKKAERIRDKKILIIDDLMTSGSTIKSASKALLLGSPAKLIAFVAARVIQ
jgi:ComF family protein